MIFTINHNDYKLNIAWNTVTLDDAVKLTNIELDEAKLMPLLDGKFTTDPEELNYIRQTLSVLSDCPAEVFEQTDSDSLVVMFDIVRYMIKQLYLMNIEEFQVQGMTELTFKGKTYYMPDTLMLNQQPILMSKEPSKNVVEAMDVMRNISDMRSKGVDQMRYICAIYLKEKRGEAYDPEAIARRAALFGELPMHVVWEVFFFTYWHTNKFMIDTNLRCFEKVGAAKKVLHLIRGFFLFLKLRWLARFAKQKK